MSPETHGTAHEHATTVFVWIHTILLSLSLFFLIDSYSILETQAFSLRQTNRALAASGFVLIGLSFAFSSFSYFLGMKNILYRKYIGLSGFAFALAHVVIALVLYGFPGRFLTNNYGIPFYCGLAAICIFAMMTAISNAYSMKHLDTLWRKLLRVGYIGYAFTLIHFLFYGVSDMVDWMGGFTSSLPPMTFFLTIFGLVVFFLRLTLHLSLMYQMKK